MKITIEADDGCTTYIYDKVWSAKFEEIHTACGIKDKVVRVCTLTFKQTLVGDKDEHIQRNA